MKFLFTNHKICSATLAILFLSHSAIGAQFTVDTTSDGSDQVPGDGVCATTGNNCSLRAAIEESNALSGPDIIILGQGNYLLDGNLDITDDTTINGVNKSTTTISSNNGQLRINNHSNLTLTAITLSAANSSEAAIYNEGQLVIKDSHITNNYLGVFSQNGKLVVETSSFTKNSNSDNKGAAIRLFKSEAYLTGSTFDDNSAQLGAALQAEKSKIIIDSSTFTNNQATNGPQSRGGGAIYLYENSDVYITDSSFSNNYSNQNGGAIYNIFSNLTLNRTLFSQNEAAKSGGAVYTNNYGQWQTVITESEISANKAARDGGGISIYSNTQISNSLISTNSVSSGPGGGIYVFGSKNTIENSTISGNDATQVSGGISFHPLSSTAKLLLESVTVANNNPGNITSLNGMLQMEKSLIATPVTGSDCIGRIETLGYNLDSDNSCKLTDTTDKTVSDPSLGELADNGGFTKTHALLSGSPAIDAIASDRCSATDQRYYYRNADNSGCDIGSYESDSVRSRSGEIAFRDTAIDRSEADTTVTIAVSRFNGSEGDISVDYFDIGSGTATKGSDYQQIANGKLQWLNGDSSDKTIEITLKDDYLEEGTETIRLGLIKVAGGATLTTDKQTAVVNIIDNEVNYGELQFAEATYSVDESAVSLAVTIDRNQGSYGEITADFTIENKSAVSNEDFSIADSRLTFADGEISKTLNITIIDDDLDEADETFSLLLGNVSPGATIGTLNSTTITIMDNDTSATTTTPPVDQNGGTAPTTAEDKNQGEDSGQSKAESAEGNKNSSENKSGGGAFDPFWLTLLLSAALLLRKRGCSLAYKVNKREY